MDTFCSARNRLSDVRWWINLFLLLFGFIIQAQTIADFKIPGVVCARTDVVFNNTSVIDALDSVTAEWFFQGAVSEISAEPVSRWSNPGEYEVRLTLVNQRSDTFIQRKVVRIMSSPRADFDVARSICCGEKVVLTNTSTVDSGNLSFTWDYGNLQSLDSAKCGRNYAIELVVSTEEGCFDSVAKNIMIKDPVDASFTYFIEGSTVRFNGPPSNDVYRWTFEDGGKDIVQKPAYTYPKDIGKFTVCLYTKKDQCTNSECQTIGEIANFGVKKKSFLRIYPNPTSGLIQLQSSENKIWRNIEIINGWGMRVDNLVNQTNHLDVSHLPSGQYTLRFIAEDLVRTTRLIKY